MEFFEIAGRLGYMILEGSFESLLQTTKGINEGDAPIKIGAMIDPGYYWVTVSANYLGAVIEMMV